VALDGCLCSSSLLLAALAARRPAAFVGPASRKALLAGGVLAPDALALGLHFCSGPSPLLRSARRELVLAALDAGSRPSPPPDLKAFATAALGCVAFRAVVRAKAGAGQEDENEEEEEEDEEEAQHISSGVERLLAFLSS